MASIFISTCRGNSTRFTRAKIFERVQFPEIPPRVEYHLTAFGKKFLRLLKEVEKLQAELNASLN